VPRPEHDRATERPRDAGGTRAFDRRAEPDRGGGHHALVLRQAAQGKTIWRDSTSFTGTYTLHAARGNYLSLSLGYVRGPALSPRVADTLTFTANWSLYL
jgi:hypothetical protein